MNPAVFVWPHHSTNIQLLLSRFLRDKQLVVSLDIFYSLNSLCHPAPSETKNNFSPALQCAEVMNNYFKYECIKIYDWKSPIKHDVCHKKVHENSLIMFQCHCTLSVQGICSCLCMFVSCYVLFIWRDFGTNIAFRPPTQFYLFCCNSQSDNKKTWHIPAQRVYVSVVWFVCLPLSAS